MTKTTSFEGENDKIMLQTTASYLQIRKYGMWSAETNHKVKTNKFSTVRDLIPVPLIYTTTFSMDLAGVHQNLNYSVQLHDIPWQQRFFQ